MTPEQQQQNPFATWWWAIAAIVLVACVAFGYFYYTVVFSHRGEDVGYEQARSLQQQALNMQRSGSSIPHYDDAANLLKQALAVNDSPALEGYLKVNLALLMHLSGEGVESGGEQMEEGGLPKDAINLLKEVALNEKDAPGARALAYNTIADTFTNHYSSSTIAASKENIFTGPVFGALLQKGNVQLAIAGMYDLSAKYYATTTSDSFSNGAYDLYSNIISSYRAADIYLAQALTNPSLSDTQRRALYTTAVDRLAKGDAFTTMFETEVAKLDPAKRQQKMDGEYRNLGYGERMKASALGKIYLLDSARTKDEAARADAAFRTALGTLSKSKAYMVRKMDMYTRLEYASWLAAAYGKDASSTIESVLAPLYADRDASSVVRERLKNEATLIPNPPFEGIGMILIGRVSPSFESYAQESDWTSAMFSTHLAPFATIGLK